MFPSYPVGFDNADGRESNAVPWLGLTQIIDIHGYGRGDFRVSSRCLSVRQKNNGEAVARDLDAPETSGVGDDIGTSSMLNHRSLQAISHPVRLWGNRVF